MDTGILKGLIGKEIDVIIDRPIGTTHPKYKDMIYLVNYGYIDGFYGGDNEDKLVVYNYGYLSSNEIEETINFQEKYFKHEIITINSSK